MKRKTPIASLFPLLRRLVLAELVRTEGSDVNINELARRVGKDAKNVYNELKNLESSGIVVSKRTGNQVYYTLNRGCPIYPELRMLLIKTAGIADVLQDALEPIREKVRVAFIYGSVARGEERADSDVDVMVIGETSIADVIDGITKAEKELRREVNPSIFPVAEYKNKLAEGHHFIANVTKGEKIFLIGDANELTLLRE